MNKTLRPSLIYALISAAPLPIGLLFIGVFIPFFMPQIPLLNLVYLGLCGLIYLYKVLLIKNHRYTFTDEQIIYQRGVFSLYTDYIELYRIKDFKEQRPFLLRLIGCMNVVLISSDRSVPNLQIKGIPEQRLMFNLRDRVEYNRDNKRVYEVD